VVRWRCDEGESRERDKEKKIEGGKSGKEKSYRLGANNFIVKKFLEEVYV
jgi:hypothetical protein